MSQSPATPILRLPPVQFSRPVPDSAHQSGSENPDGPRIPGRRGHSDSHVPPSISSTERRSQHASRAGTVNERFRASSDVLDHNQVAARRRAMILEDRRRHFTDYRDSQARRASSTLLARPRYPPLPPIRDSGPLSRNRPSASSLPGSFDPFTSGVHHRPLPRLPNDGASETHPSRLPTWEPDENTSECPICRTAFSFWFRKHHCRKCGRVVCANCSPHRITIPKQYIVHPPDAHPIVSNTPAIADVEVVDLTEEEDQDSSPTRSLQDQAETFLQGGQEVRLCNPCVPDPNPSPHIPYQPPNPAFPMAPPRSSSNGSGHSSNREHQTWDLAHVRLPPTHEHTRQDHMQQYRQIRSGASQNTISPPNSALPNQARNRFGDHGEMDPAISQSNISSVFGSLPSTMDTYYPEILQRRHRADYQNHRHHASLGFIPSSTRGPPRPELREEDECPICHGALPPIEADGSELARERHISECIDGRLANTSGHPLHSPSSPTMEPASRVRSASSTDPATRSGLQGDAAAAHDLRRTTGILVYHATEKDCQSADEEGEAECVICFEEFAVGDEMGRLECLCRFHRKCIRQWWEMKGPGVCPVHQHGH